MIPQLIKTKESIWQILPPGIHITTMSEVKERFAINAKRRMLFRGLEKGVDALIKAGCNQIYLDGSYITSKPSPNDYDACWDVTGVRPEDLDPVLLIFDLKRQTQKNKFLGEYFPMHWVADHSGATYLDFFQIDKNTSSPKGILNIKLSRR